MDPLLTDAQLLAQLALKEWSSNTTIRHTGRAPSFGKIHTKSIRSTRTLDSNFMAEYHTELDNIRCQWEMRVFRYWERCWDRSHSAQGCLGQERPVRFRFDSCSAQVQLLQPSRTPGDCFRGLSALKRNIQRLYRRLELKRHQTKAISSKQKIDVKYRRQLGMRKCKTGADDFPIDLEDLVCYWDPWYVTEFQPTPYVRSTIGGSYTIDEYYSSDHQLRLRKVHQKDSIEAVKACFRPDDFDKLDVMTLYIYDPKPWP
ncbi:hypothetical protein F4677DRAFT_385084 [Hypoxylon crocopeplum]|nr:hypothetical protein F4677DRAFT_385084 [Hypoxylon crocopeplum]